MDRNKHSRNLSTPARSCETGMNAVERTLAREGMEQAMMLAELTLGVSRNVGKFVGRLRQTATIAVSGSGI
jgi:hypothetical protein